MADPPVNSRRLWWVTLAGCVSLVELYLYGPSPAPLLLCGVIAARHWLPWRLTAGTVLAWATRIFLILSAVLYGFNAGPVITSTLFNPVATYALGLVLAVEMAIQAWQDEGPPAQAGLLLLMNSAGVAVMASNNLESGSLAYLHPIYVLLLWFSFRAYLPPVERRATRNRAAAGWLALAAAGVLATGYGSGYLLQTYKQQLMEWSEQWARTTPVGPTSGISASPRLGAMRDVELSSERVLRVEGLEGTAHLRGAAFATYWMGSWQPDLATTPFDSAPSSLEATAPGKSVRFARYRDLLGLLPLPLSARGIEVQPDAVLLWAPAAGHALRARGAAPFNYSARIPPGETAQGAIAVAPTPRDLERYLRVPDNIDVGVRALARQMVPASARAPERAAAVVAYLQSNHSYSLTVDPGPGDPLNSFLLEKKSAHCEYFGSAATMLLRLLDVPARYVTGYFANESAGPETTVVRQRDAHAWCEAWIEGVGWITVEATPGDGRPDNSPDTVPPWRKLMEQLQDAWHSALAWLQSGTLGERLLPFTPFLGLAVAGWALLRARRKRTPAAASLYPDPTAELAAIAARFNELLRRAGRPCPASTPWTEHLEKIESAAAPPFELEEARRFAREYNAARFGAPGVAGAPENLAAQIERLERQLAQARMNPAR